MSDEVREFENDQEGCAAEPARPCPIDLAGSLAGNGSGTETPLSSRWQRWLVRRLVEGIATPTVVDTLHKQGYERTVIEQSINKIKASTIYEVARAIEGQRQKAHGLLDALAEVARQGGALHTCPTESDIEPQRFYDEYFYQNRPVIVKGLMRQWRALDKWNVDYFRKSFGEVVIEAMDQRGSIPEYDRHYDKLRHHIQMNEFLDRITANNYNYNDIYLVGRSRLLQRPEFRCLFDDFQPPAGFLDPADATNVHLWFGPKGTISPLHHDSTNVFFGQVLGRKRLRLISPLFSERVYNRNTYYSDVNLNAIDYGRFPRMRGVPIIDVTTEPGDFLLIPIGWWHEVRSQELSITMSFHNFIFSEGRIVWKKCASSFM